MSTNLTIDQIVAIATQAAVAAVNAALIEPDAKAKVTRTVEAPTTAKPAKAYRSAKGKEQAKAQVSALWAKTLKDAKATKRAQLTDAQFEAYQAGAKAIWAAVPKTRSTKA